MRLHYILFVTSLLMAPALVSCSDESDASECAPPFPDQCTVCVYGDCCSQVLNCEADPDCLCMTQCLYVDGLELTACFGQCSVDGPPQTLSALFTCEEQSCIEACR